MFIMRDKGRMSRGKTRIGNLFHTKIQRIVFFSTLAYIW